VDRPHRPPRHALHLHPQQDRNSQIDRSRASAARRRFAIFASTPSCGAIRLHGAHVRGSLESQFGFQGLENRAGCNARGGCEPYLGRACESGTAGTIEFGDVEGYRLGEYPVYGVGWAYQNRVLDGRWWWERCTGEEGALRPATRTRDDRLPNLALYV
jgi:hypothetical protein